MPTEQRYKFVTSALKVLFFLFFSVTLSFAHAASLGRLTVLSSLGQPLRAEVELTSITPEEASTLAASLAPGEAYKRSGIDYTSLLQTLNLSVEKEGDRYFVSIRSAQPVNEPYIGILLELSTDSERKGREYVITLDPAEWTNLRSAPLSSAASMQSLSRQQRAARQSSRAFPVTAVRPVSVIPEKENRGATDYVVSRGDTLSKIAGRLGGRNISLEQMLVVLYRNNPDAFLDNNMNLLREGAVLSIPQTVDAGDVSDADARRVVRLHAANFRGYSHRLAGMVQKSAPRATAKTGPVAEGKVSASVKEQPSPVSKMPDRLELSKARQDAVSAGITPEEKSAMNRAIEDANRRITELEKNVSELRSLLEIVSKNGNALTRPAEAVSAQEAKTPETGPKDAQPKAEEPAKTDVDSPQAVSGTIEKTPSSDTDASSEEKKTGIDPDQTLAGKKAQVSKKSDEDDEDDEDEDEDDEDEDDEEPKKKPGFLNGALWYVAAGVTLALLVLIILVLRMRRKKPAAPVSTPRPVVKPQEEEEEDDANPNIISGRDFLESITGREVVDEEEDEDEESYRPMMDDDDDDDTPSARHEDEEVLEEIADTPEEAEEPEEIAEAPEDVIPEPEEEEDEEEAEPEEVIPEPEEADEEDVEEDAAPEPEEVEEEAVPSLASEPEDAADEDDVALELDDSDEPVEEAVEPEEEEEDEPAPLELNLADINLEPDAAEEEEDLPDMASLAEAEKPEPYNAEMAAKLELAQAYLDMKDKDGARELLEEVLERGTPRQINEAQQLIQYL